jgi:hypothetical protein
VSKDQQPFNPESALRQANTLTYDIASDAVIARIQFKPGNPAKLACGIKVLKQMREDLDKLSQVYNAAALDCQAADDDAPKPHLTADGVIAGVDFGRTPLNPIIRGGA